MSTQVKLWTTAIAVAVVAGAVGYALGHRGSTRSVAQNGVVVATNDSTQSERKILYWHDPMVPGAKFDKPGKSPFMDMQLVPVYADEVSSSAVRISPNVAQNLGIRMGKVARRALSSRLDAVGSVAFDERLVEVVQARVSGYVTRLYVKTPLEGVRRGQALAEILAPEWLAAQQDYLALLDAPSSAQLIRDAARQRLVVLGIPEATIGALEKDRKTHPTITVFAPIDGVVTELAVREGAGFAAGGPLMRLNGLSTVWVNAQIPEAQVSLVAPGKSVEAKTTAWPAVTLTGRMIALLPAVDAQTRTLTARVAIENPQRKLSPGMFVSLTFTTPTDELQLVVPSEAVIVTGERSVVIVVRDDGGFDVADVKTGIESNGVTPILAGLEEGQSIVLSGQFLIDSEASLRSTMDRLTGPSAPAPIR
jgi:membrane fusion protein, copper/silver efflux system